MCGILVVLAKDGSLDAAACRRALGAMSWRGPDFAFSRVWEDRLFLGQTVLSITGDPRPGLGEYHRSRSGRYEVFYNGEIYNTAELEATVLGARPELAARWGTDTEVLVNLHEVLSVAEVPRRLDGMYAYALFDAQARGLHVARDVQGEKSLYVYEDERRLVVASEIRAIGSLVPLALDRQALRDYFRTRHLMLFERTVRTAVREIGPGRVETLDLDTGKWSETAVLRLRDWIDPRRMAAHRRRAIDDVADELESVLTRCVREMIPARRYAAVVSGGVDSSLLAHYVVRHGPPDGLVAVNHIGKDRLSADLSAFSRVLGRPIETLAVDATAYAAELPRCQDACGGLLHSHSFVAQSQQSAAVRAAGCRVLFGGEGADELFGGYGAYLEPPSVAPRFSPSPYTACQAPLLRFCDDAPALIEEAAETAWQDAFDAYAFVDDPAERIALAMMYCDAAHQLPAVGLRGADLMSMMWSVETRSVYLRRPVVELALNLPAPLKADRRAGPADLATKPLLKRLFLRHFPAALLAPKQGFAGFPNEAGAWLGDPADYVAPGYLGAEAASLGGAWADRATAWKLINLEYFLRGLPVGATS
jgi:asparagine synthase (glutamine-hydrolysing)